ncbi:MAG: COX15/CtaA family protein [Gammaproteobacteria bacterium]|nr:COX15/CtaA family protein [Gammaproteobacteria bacterium]
MTTESGISAADRRRVILWLYLCSGMVFAMVVLGGAVRLTGSGLSMVDWKPLMGVLPPLNQAAWEEAFARYREYPEYRLVNRDMTLESFRFIYYMEYLHRLIGRLVGVVFVLPFVYWLMRGALPAWTRPRLWTALVLGAAQGLLGWYMVMSGLVDNPHVSQYRLTAHLLLAVFIFAWLLALVFRLQGISGTMPLAQDRLRRFRRLAGVVIVLVFAMIATGGFMAGTKAGFIFNTWPMMGNQWMPDQVWALVPWWRNLVDNPLGIQFVHRWLALVVLVAVGAFGMLVARHARDRVTAGLGIALLAMLVAQVGLGIAALVNSVPLALGVVHQGGALVLLALLIALWSRFRADHPTTT